MNRKYMKSAVLCGDILGSMVIEYFPEQNVETDVEVNYEKDIAAIASIPDLVGGIKLVRNNGGITLGVCGTYRNSSVILTCGHGCSVGDTVYLSDGTLVGTVVKQQFDNSENYDYAIIGLTSAATSSVTSKVKTNSGTQNITSSSYSAVEGMSIKCYGQKSGYKTGTVTAINVGRTLSGTLVEGLVEVSTSTAIQGGDSGGPVYAGSKMYGTISGPQNATVWCFSPAAVVSGFSV